MPIVLHPQVAKLNQLPQVAQRSEEWFMSRKMRVTASEICSVLGVNPYKSRNVYWKEKLSVLRNEPEKERTTSWISEWGVRYEPIVQNIIRENYRRKLGVSVKQDPTEVLYEYGMINHPLHSFLGASPDGILADGTMVEIKCPPTRQIEEHEIVPYYYSQMQLQLECCELSSLDFIECKFYEYNSFASFSRDSQPDNRLESIEGKQKGIILQRGKEYTYYDPHNDVLTEWQKKLGAGPFDSPAIGCKYFFWKIECMSTKRVTKNQEYIAKMIEETKVFWQSVYEASLVPSILACTLPPPKSFYFENFVADDLFIVYRKKGDMQEETEVITDDQRGPKRARCAFKL